MPYLFVIFFFANAHPFFPYGKVNARKMSQLQQNVPKCGVKVMIKFAHRLSFYF
jgi:hypothetical protein